jgi:hypothetical protein
MNCLDSLRDSIHRLCHVLQYSIRSIYDSHQDAIKHRGEILCTFFTQFVHFFAFGNQQDQLAGVLLQVTFFECEYHQLRRHHEGIANLNLVTLCDIVRFDY